LEKRKLIAYYDNSIADGFKKSTIFLVKLNIFLIH